MKADGIKIAVRISVIFIAFAALYIAIFYGLRMASPSMESIPPVLLRCYGKLYSPLRNIHAVDLAIFFSQDKSGDTECKVMKISPLFVTIELNGRSYELVNKTGLQTGKYIFFIGKSCRIYWEKSMYQAENWKDYFQSACLKVEVR